MLLTMAKINHDKLFKELLTTFFVEFLDLLFPSVLEYLDTDSIQFVEQELFTDLARGSINGFMLAAAKSALGWQAPVDSVKMLKLISNLESRVHQLEQELKKLRQN